MTITKVIKTLLLGLNLGIQSIAITVCCSPLLIIIHLYVDALERGSEHWNLNGLPFEIYCIGGPVMILLWFSLPYLLGGGFLAFIVHRINGAFKQQVGSAITGMVAGLMGNYFLVNSWGEFHLSDWVLIGLMEIWSIVIFVWIGNRANRNLMVSNNKTDI